MKSVKFSSKMDEALWKSLQKMSRDTHRSISGILTEAAQEYLKRKTLRPQVLQHFENSVQDNEELGKLLAK